jgi:hypothetical protein
MDPRPGRFVRHLDFNHFRTIGMCRSVEEDVISRFVTGERVQAVLKVFLSLRIKQLMSLLYSRKCQISSLLVLRSTWTGL